MPPTRPKAVETTPMMQRGPRTPDELGQHVAAEAVQPERELRELARAGDVRRGDVRRGPGSAVAAVGRQPRREDRDEHEQRDDDGADPCASGCGAAA